MKAPMQLHLAAAVLMLGALTTTLVAPLAQAGNGSWNSGPVNEWRSRGSQRGWNDHSAHRWHGGTLYCGGRTSDGRWRNEHRCEDAYGRKKVDLIARGELDRYGNPRRGYDRADWRDDDRRRDDRRRDDWRRDDPRWDDDRERRDWDR